MKTLETRELLSLLNDMIDDTINKNLSSGLSSGLSITPPIQPVIDRREKIYEENKPVLESFNNLADKWRFTINKYVESEMRFRDLKNEYQKLQDKYDKLNDDYKKLQNNVIEILAKTINDNKIDTDI